MTLTRKNTTSSPSCGAGKFRHLTENTWVLLAAQESIARGVLWRCVATAHNCAFEPRRIEERNALEYLGGCGG